MPNIGMISKVKKFWIVIKMVYYLAIKNKTHEDCETWGSVHGALLHETLRIYVGYDGKQEKYSCG